MKLALSNIRLTPYDDLDQLRCLPDFGLDGLEVAPSRVWADTWHGLTEPRCIHDGRTAGER